MGHLCARYDISTAVPKALKLATSDYLEGLQRPMGSFHRSRQRPRKASSGLSPPQSATVSIFTLLMTAVGRRWPCAACPPRLHVRKGSLSSSSLQDFPKSGETIIKNPCFQAICPSASDDPWELDRLSCQRLLDESDFSISYLPSQEVDITSPSSRMAVSEHNLWLGG